METYKHKVKWQVSLSNGETFFEGKGDFAEIEGAESPWLRLDRYAAKNKALITSLSLYTDEGQRFNLPSAGKNPKFPEFEVAEKPIDYHCFRRIARDMVITGGEVSKTIVSDWYTVAEAIYPTYKLQLWVDEQNPENCWVLVKEN